MRRFSVIISVLAMLIVVFVIGLARGTAAQDATPPAVALPALFQAWLDTYEAEDAEGLAALYTPDGIYEDVPSGNAAVGTEEIVASAEGFFAYQDEYDFVPTAFYEGDGWAVMEFLSSATDAGSGIRVSDVPIVAVFELEDGLIRRSSDYYDLYGVMIQLGWLSEEDATENGTPVP